LLILQEKFFNAPNMVGEILRHCWRSLFCWCGLEDFDAITECVAFCKKQYERKLLGEKNHATLLTLAEDETAGIERGERLSPDP
jgi:hypothetical protein